MTLCGWEHLAPIGHWFIILKVLCRNLEQKVSLSEKFPRLKLQPLSKLFPCLKKKNLNLVEKTIIGYAH